MGKASRRKATKSKTPQVEFVARPFEGLPHEAAWVAMREIIPSATGQVKLQPGVGDAPEGTDLLVCTVLPGGYLAMHRPDGTIMLALQDALTSPDVSRDLAAATLAAIAAGPGTALGAQPVTGDAPRLQDIVVADEPFDIVVHDNYDYWVDEGAQESDLLTQSLREAAESSVPTQAVAGVPDAYWCQMASEFVRWVRTEDEDAVVDAISRLQAARQAGLEFPDGNGRFLGMFRAEGLTIPVWELPDGTGADGLAGPMAELAERFEAALAKTDPLTADERRARAGILSRQVTLR